MVGRDILVREGLCRGDALSGVEDKHLVQEIESWSIAGQLLMIFSFNLGARTRLVVALQLRLERLSLPLRQALHES